MAQYRKKPVVVEAVQWTGENLPELEQFMQSSKREYFVEYRAWKNTLHIRTLEGIMAASPGDYIIKGVNGEFYPCKPDIFAKTYEEVK